MCGIAGIYADDPRRPVERERVERMVAAMRHRGPDGAGFHHGPGVCIGMCRLAIIDIGGGDQPMYVRDGRLALIQNGEIYNHVELRQDLRATGYPGRTRSDTEVLLDLFDRDDEAFVRALNGMFAVAVYDADRHRLVLARDRLGKKPLYLWREDGLTVFASELAALLASGLVPDEVDDTALADLLSYNYIPGDATPLRGVRQLPPAHVGVMQDGAFTSRRYWDPIPERATDGALPDLLEEFRELLADAVRIRLRADVPVGMFLSSGVDSSAIAWAVGRESDRGAVTTYTVSFPGDEVDEGDAAAATAAGLGLPHERLIASDRLLEHWPDVLDHAGAPHGDVSFMAVSELSRLAADRFRVALTGDGADEVLAGYSWQAGPGGAPLARDPVSLRTRWERNCVFTTEEKRALLRLKDTPDAYGHFEERISEAAHLDSVAAHGWADTRVLLPGNNLVKVDRMGMAHSLELRSPFLDYRLIEFALRVPGAHKVGPSGGKLLLRSAVEAHLPGGALARPKHLFRVPFARWAEPGGPADALLDRMLREPTDLLAGRFDDTALRAIVDGHRRGDPARLRQVRLLLALDLWSRDREDVGAREAGSVR